MPLGRHSLILFSNFGTGTVFYQGALKESQRERERVEREREQLERRLEEAEGRGNTKLQINQLKVRENGEDGLGSSWSAGWRRRRDAAIQNFRSISSW